jgi:protein SCO1/2
MKRAVVLFSFWLATTVHAAPPPALDLEVEEHLGAQLPAALRFTDERGRSVHLGDYFRDGKPILLTLAYFRCPMLCDLVLRGVLDGTRGQPLALGRDYRALTVSFDPRDRPAAAASKQRALLQAANRPDSAADWPFLVADDETARALGNALGYRWVFDPKSGDFAHPAVAFVLTGDGKISRYLYGVSPRPFDLRLAISEAANGRAGGSFERLLLTCFRWDPSERKYGLALSRGARAGGALTLLAIAAGYFLLFRKKRVAR